MCEVVRDGVWDEDRLRELLHDDIVMHILENINPPVEFNELSKPYWMLENRWEFSVKSSWEYLRKMRDPNIVYENMWVKGLPFKISFSMWRLWKRNLPLDDTIRRWGYFMSSRCWCCINPDEEIVAHIFFKSYTASKGLDLLLFL